jgi:Zn-dependent membrane protease YugP
VGATFGGSYRIYIVKYGCYRIGPFRGGTTIGRLLRLHTSDDRRDGYLGSRGALGEELIQEVLQTNEPRSKVVRLSEGNFNKNSIAAVSVAAHECGHAIQDAVGYVPMKLRAGIFPVVAFSSQIWVYLFIAGLFGLGNFFIQLAAILFLAVLAFHVVTLPVEINASTRAYGILTRYGMLSAREADGTKRVLTAAAFTYIAAALTAVITFLYLLFLSQNE